MREHAGAECVSLADYRRRYAQYKSDPDLQAAHAVAPWIVVPDDHEVKNNYANMVRADSSPALTAAQWTARRTAAYQAYYEKRPAASSCTSPHGWSIPLGDLLVPNLTAVTVEEFAEAEAAQAAVVVNVSGYRCNWWIRRP